MTLQKIEFEYDTPEEYRYDIPEGYRFVRYGEPINGEQFLSVDGSVIITFDSGMMATNKIIVEKIPEQEQQKLKLQYKTQQGDWRDVIDGYEYRIKPKIKTIRFRNYLDRYFGTVKVVRSGVPSDLGKWLGDWQDVEVEE